MHKKKIQALAVAGVLTVGVVGGTLAWFTSQDSVKNTFNTGASNDENGKGIKIVEEFKSPEAMLPGDEVNKDVQVSNTATYDQFIKVKLSPKFVEVGKDGSRNEIKQREITNELGQKQTCTLDTSKIILNFTKNLKKDKSNGSWFKDGDYYYYMGKVKPSELTSMLLDSVTLDKNAGNEYRGLVFDIDVEAESIQASNDAYEDWVKSDELKGIFKNLQNQDAVGPTDAKEQNKNN